MKKLRIGNFYVHDIKFGKSTTFKSGVLTVNKDEAIDYLNPEGKLKNIKLYVVHPGEKIRLVPAKAAVEPRFRPDGRCTFPGFNGPVSDCGDGVVYALKGMSVICCGKYGNMVDGLVDMAGPGAEHSIFSKLVNLVVYAERTNEKDLDLTIRVEDEQKMAAHLLADYVAKTLKDLNPESWEEYELESKAKEAEKKHLPNVAYFLIICSQLANGCNDVVMGDDCHNMLPILVHPNDILDGMITAKFGLMGQCSTAYGYQNQPVIRRLYQEHGKTINFKGVVLCPADVSNNMKLRVKECCGEIASLMKLDGAIVAEFGGGSNIDVDYFYILSELEDRKIKTVGIMAEHGGKMLQDPKANAIVTGGDTGAVYELPPMDFIIGDLKSVVRDYYYGSWPVHSIYGPSLRTDGSLIINMYMIADGGNSTGFLKKTVKDY
jgi:hypothetical protein